MHGYKTATFVVLIERVEGAKEGLLMTTVQSFQTSLQELA
jgi:hypothetical protein